MAVAPLLLALVVGAVPAQAASSWPTIADVRHEEPGISRSGARCMVAAYRGTLSRSEMLGDYWKLTRAKKLVEESAEAACMTVEQRITAAKRDLTRGFDTLGVRASSEIDCAAHELTKVPLRSRIAVASRADEVALFDPLARRCGLLGALFGGVATKLHVPVTAVERRCTNEHGTFAVVSKSESRRVLGLVFDRCITTATRVGFWRYVLREASLPASRQRCVARRLATRLTFKQILARSPRLQSEAVKAAGSCI